MSKMDVAQKKCTTPEFRVSFPSVFEAKSFNNQEPKFSIAMLFTKTTDLKELKRAANNALIEKWGSDKAKWPKGLRSPFRDGNDKPDLDGYKDTILVSASSKTRPGVVGNKIDETTGKLRVITKDDANPDGGQLFYAGCYARATLIAFAYDTSGNKGVSFSLQNIQKLRDGKPFSGKKAATEEFGEVADASDDAGAYGEEQAEEVGGF